MIAEKRRNPIVKAVPQNKELVRKRREQILQAAERMFNKKGFHRTTVREIAKAGKLSTGSIYDYVRNKQDILFLIYEKIMTEMHSVIQSETNVDRGFDRKLKGMLTKILMLADRYQDLILILFQESRNFKKDHLRAMLMEESKFIRVFEDILKECKERRLIDTYDPKLAGNIVSFLTLLGVLRRWKLRHEYKRDELIKGVIEFVFHGIGYRGSL